MELYIPESVMMIFGVVLCGVIIYRYTLSPVTRETSKEKFDRWIAIVTLYLFRFLGGYIVYSIVRGAIFPVPGPIDSRQLFVLKGIMLWVAYPCLGIGSERDRHMMERSQITNPFYPVFVIMGLAASFMVMSSSHLLVGGLLLMIQGLAFLFMMLSKKSLREVIPFVSLFYRLYGGALGMYAMGCGLLYSNGWALDMRLLPNFVHVSLLGGCGIVFILLSLLLMMGGMLYPLWGRQGLALSPFMPGHILFWIVVIKSSILLYALRLWDLFHPTFVPLAIGFSLVGLALSAFKSLRLDIIRRILLNQSNIDFCLIFLSVMAGSIPLALMILIISIFTIASLTFYTSYLSYNDQTIISIKQLKGIASAYPLLSALLMMTLLSPLSMIPTAGFFIKLNVLSLLMASYSAIGIGVALLIVLSSFVYLRVIKFIYFMDHEFYTIHSDFKILNFGNLLPIILILYMVIAPYMARLLSSPYSI